MTWPEGRALLGRLAANPLLLRALRARGVEGFLGMALLYAALPALSIAVPVGYALAFPSPFFKVPQAMAVGTRIGTTLAGVLLLLVGASLVATAVSRERMQNTLQGLLITPLHPAELAAGKWLGACLPVLAAALLLAAATLVGTIGGGIPPGDWAGVWAMLLGASVFFQTLTLWAALVAAKPESAKATPFLALMTFWLLGAADMVPRVFRIRPWVLDAMWLTPFPALDVLWGWGSTRLWGSTAYLLGPLYCAGGAALCLTAAARKLHDRERPALPRGLLLAIAPLLGAYAGWHDAPQGEPALRIGAVAAVLLWGLAAALVAVPSRHALEAARWKDLRRPERLPARRFLALGTALLLLALDLSASLVTAGFHPPRLGWIAAALGVLAFGELLALCRLLFPRRGTVLALFLLAFANVLPPVAVLLLLNPERPGFWYVLWGPFTELGGSDQVRALLASAAAYAVFSALARWQERLLDGAVDGRRRTLLAPPE